MVRRTEWSRRVLGCLLCCWSALVFGQGVPPALEDWQGWVLRDVDGYGCPWLATTPDTSDHQCLWPGQLEVSVGDTAANFTLHARIDAPSWVPLPGNDEFWPQAVRANGNTVPVLEHAGTPAVQLPIGDWRIDGRIAWTERPARLPIPDAIGLIELRVDDTAITQLERSGGRLTLGQPVERSGDADTLAVRVYRLLSDGLPPMLSTRIELDVSGDAREVMLHSVLPAGFVGTSLSTDLPARLGDNNQLEIQVRPGKWVLHLAARGTEVLSSVPIPDHAGPWPGTEVWSYQDQPQFRHTRVDGQAVDARRADVPARWQSLPAFVLDADHGLAMEQVSRGSGPATAPEITVDRELWLGFDGDTLFARDFVRGSAGPLHRLAVVPPWQLLSANDNGEPLLVTVGESGQGVEVRDRELVLAASLRLADFAGAFPASGWQVPVRSVSALLHLPAGAVLLGAPGADESPDSWVARWNLLDLFVAALIALLAGRLLGWPWALVAAGYLLLAGHVTGAPRWSLLLTLVLGLLAAALPSGRLRTVAASFARVLLLLAVLLGLPFATEQVKLALYPQLAAETSLFEAASRLARQAMEPQLMAEDAVRSVNAPSAKVEAESVMAVEAPTPSPPAPPTPVPVQAPASTPGLVQAGTGIPDWDLGNNQHLAWSGPVHAARSTRLVIAPPWMVRILKVVMLALLAALLARTLRVLLPSVRLPRPARGGTTAVMALLGLLAVPWANAQQAIPDAELRNELRVELTDAPECAPACIVISSAALRATGDSLAVELIIHAGADTGVPLPAAGPDVSMISVTVDGEPVSALVRSGGDLLSRVERGVHRLVVAYSLAGVDDASLRFPVHPKELSFEGSAWQAGGMDAHALAGDTLILRRKAVETGAAMKPAVQAFPPYVRLTRTLSLGNQWIIHNRLDRIAPATDGFTVRVPTLADARPLGERVRLADGRIEVTFRSGEQQVAWDSQLAPRDRFELIAPDLARHAEVWHLLASTDWHVETSGVPETAAQPGRTFLPLPDETLVITATQLPAVPGAALAFDRVDLHSQVGARATETTVEFVARSTRGGEHVIVMPPDATLLKLSRDGAPIMAEPRDGRIGLPLLPGSHEYRVEFRQPVGAGLNSRTASIALGAEAANVDLNLYLPDDRWLLLTAGPGVGPAVLYWPLLVVFVLLAWLLGRYAPTPLRFHHWLLLALGFSAFSWAAFVFVVLWLIVLGVRSRHWPQPGTGRTAFNLGQVALALMTVVAIAVLISVIPRGLLGLPDMHVAGNGSRAQLLRWFVDRAGADWLPTGTAISLPLWVYKVAILAWALWLANALIAWLRWGFEAWSRNGYWRQRDIAVAPRARDAD